LNDISLWQAAILGLLQGLSEFLPISSSAHLSLTPWVFNWPAPGLAFDVALHVGTLAAVLWFFRREWIDLTKAALRIVTGRGSMATLEGDSVTTQCSFPKDMISPSARWSLRRNTP
jgi:undecaprenyl pyrophosphate phosphatase UppP